MMTNFTKYAGPLARNPSWDPGNDLHDGLAVGLDGGRLQLRGGAQARHSVGVLFDKKYAGKVGMMSDPQELGSVGLLAIGVEPATSTESDWRKAATFLHQAEERRHRPRLLPTRITSTT